MNEYQVRVYFASGRMSYNIGTLIKGDYNSSKLVFDFDDDTGIKMFELLKPDGETKWVKEIVNNEIVLADTDELGEVIPLLTQEGTYIFEVAKYDGNSKLTSVKGKFKVKDEQVSTSDIPLEEDSKVELDDLINDVAKVVEEGTEATANTIEQAEYAKQQGDYAKEQAQIIIDANTTATKIINDFETNVNEHTKDFNANAESKENSYNENASNKLKEYNDNATTKLSEYNSNSETKTKAFDTNASEKTDAFNLNVTNKTTDFNSNAEVKTTEFNDNATTKTEEYNTNAEAKVNEFNTTVDELKQDVEDCYNNMLTNEVEGTSIHVEDSANARILVLESEGNCEQVTTVGNQLVDFNGGTPNTGSTKTFVNDVLKVVGDGSTAYQRCDYVITDVIVNNPNKIIYLDYETITSLNSPNGSIAMLTITYNDGTSTSYYTLVGRNLEQKSYSIPSDTSNISKVVLGIYTSNSATVMDNAITITKPMLQFGTDKLAYESFTKCQPSPSPDYPQEVEVLEGEIKYKLINKNLVDFSKYYDKSNLITTFDFTDDVLTFGSTVDTAYSSVKYNITDIFKKNIGRYVSFDFEDAEQTNAEAAPFIRLLTTYNNGLPDRYEVLVGNKFNNKRAVQLLSIDGAGNPVDLDNIKLVCLQFVLNVQATEMINTVTIKKPILYFGTERLLNGDVFNYVPHESNEMLVNLQGNFKGKIGDVADTLRVENGRAILTKRIGKVILDGSENWSYDQTYAIFSSNVLIGAKDDKEVINTLSDRFVSVSYNNRGGDFARIYANNSWVAIRGVKQTTVDEFKIWLQANPMTVYYVLTEPYEVDLGEVTMPKTYEGVTNISMIANLESNMKLKYVRSTNIVVDNLAKAIVALGGEINV